MAAAFDNNRNHLPRANTYGYTFHGRHLLEDISLQTVRQEFSFLAARILTGRSRTTDTITARTIRPGRFNPD